MEGVTTADDFFFTRLRSRRKPEIHPLFINDCRRLSGTKTAGTLRMEILGGSTSEVGMGAHEREHALMPSPAWWREHSFEKTFKKLKSLLLFPRVLAGATPAPRLAAPAPWFGLKTRRSHHRQQ